MRCPKCGYISFDHIDTCLKCKKPIPEGASQTVGTTYNVEAPSFLKIQSSGNQTSSLMEQHDDFGDVDDEHDVVDPDLEILLDEETDEEDGEIEFNGRYEEVGGELQITTDDEEDEIDFQLDAEEDEGEIDLGQFGDFEEEEAEELEEADTMEEEGEIEITMPDEIGDISDLSSPSDEEKVVAQQESGEEAQMSGDGFDLNLDLDDLDSNFSLSSEDAEGKPANVGDLSFDDIGLSDEPAPVKPALAKKGSLDDMDADLDFDLDLGDLFKKKE